LCVFRLSVSGLSCGARRRRRATRRHGLSRWPPPAAFLVEEGRFVAQRNLRARSTGRSRCRIVQETAICNAVCIHPVCYRREIGWPQRTRDCRPNRCDAGAAWSGTPKTGNGAAGTVRAARRPLSRDSAVRPRSAARRYMLKPLQVRKSDIGNYLKCPRSACMVRHEPQQRI
jgi:hypothetical protein